MAILTIYSLAEQAIKLITGSGGSAGAEVSYGEIKVAVAQVVNKLLKVEYLSINGKMGETIPNGSVLGLYEGITPTSWITGRSKAILPVKPMKLPRNMGIWSIYRTNDPENEFIPLQMGQTNLIKSQGMLNGLLGQIGYEALGGMDIAFTKDLTSLYPNETLSMRLAVMDASLYGDYDPLPLPPEFEMDAVAQVVKLYSGEPVADKVVDPGNKEQTGVPINQQRQTP